MDVGFCKYSAERHAVFVKAGKHNRGPDEGLLATSCSQGCAECDVKSG